MFYAIRFEFKQIVFFVRIKIPPNNASEELNSDPKPKDVHWFYIRVKDDGT
jgi:hypothetical protein